VHIETQFSKALRLWHALSVFRTCQSKVSNCEEHCRNTRISAGAGVVVVEVKTGVIVICWLVIPTSIPFHSFTNSSEFPMPIKCGFHIVIRPRLSIWQCAPGNRNEPARRQGHSPGFRPAGSRMSCQSKLIAKRDPWSRALLSFSLHVQLMCKLTLSSARTARWLVSFASAKHLHSSCVD